MDGLMPIVRRVRRPLVEAGAREAAPSAAVVATPVAAPAVPVPLVETVRGEEVRDGRDITEALRKIAVRTTPLAAMVFLVFVMTGCSSMFTELPQALATVRTVPAEEVAVRSATNAATGEVLVERTTNVVSLMVTNWSTNVVFTVSEKILRPLAVAQEANAAVSVVAPNPVSAGLNVALVGVSGLLGWIARLKSRRAQEHLDLVDTMIAGVETANLPEVKARVAEMSRLFGTKAALHERVQAITRGQ